uniref:Thioredoxin domain-containing protein n=1 Tax=Hemiselmis tepida TaxID=464990 RepID=A0A7S0V9G1_9CRYP|eukprot:CAMPEP_0174923058 /NCGR_PEP_ID=MMETSP1355-20121228/6328_1 /TAXON_ID=464990 /ORGANISM="Hemiselmis tepida, Strain CCMP443" /LENGTH=232 /DNA_ID=CAMNT_0016168713 /DNA_START=97 /DNA_END=795 /DNA_ORIENTATION=+
MSSQVTTAQALCAFSLCLTLVALGGMHSGASRPLGLLAVAGAAPSRQQLVQKEAAELAKFKVSKAMSLQAAQTLSAFSSKLCGQAQSSQHYTASDITGMRRRADSNWWSVIKAFKTADEVKGEVMADPSHVHLLVYVAPGWCQFSQKQVAELQKSFDSLGNSQSRVHLIDVDDPENANLVAYQGVKSFPTIVAVEGNYVLGKSEGYKAFADINRMAYADNGGKVFDSTFPSR